MGEESGVSVTIVGLGVVGTSLGLALKHSAPRVRVVGHDPDAKCVARARKLGAIDKSHWNLISACEKAAVIVLDLPLDAVEKTLTALQHELTEGTLIIDTCPVKRPVMEWAARILPETVQFIGGHVVLRRSSVGMAEPSAELLKGAAFCLVVPERTNAGALDMASNLAVAVGATPLYVDALEHDGLVAAASQLPVMAALATVNAVRESSGWRDRARLIGEDLSAVGSILINMSAATAEGVLSNADNVLHWLDAYTLELTRLRKLISQGDHSHLGKLLKEARETCLEWLSGEEARRPEAPKQQKENVWRSLFLGGLGGRWPR